MIIKNTCPNIILMLVIAILMLAALPAHAAAPEINLKGNNLSIRDGSLHALPNNHTYFDGVSVSTGTINRIFTIENTEDADLTLSGTPKVSITGANSSDFTVSVATSSPVSASGSTTKWP